MTNPLARYEAPIALFYCAVILTLMEYLLIPPRVEAWLHGARIFGWQSPSLEAGLVWAASCLILFLALPLAIVKFLVGGPLAQYGLSVSGFLKHLRTYLLLYLLMIPVIYLASTREQFLRVYPFVSEATTSTSAFLIWEAAYVLQFFALESFFRGYLLFTLSKHTEKWLAITMMTVPYTMIHFHKPMPEAFAAAGAGLVLGYFALRYRTWLGGAVLHSLVAVTMDTLACAKAGLFNQVHS